MIIFIPYLRFRSIIRENETPVTIDNFTRRGVRGIILVYLVGVQKEAESGLPNYELWIINYHYPRKADEDVSPTPLSIQSSSGSDW